MLFPKVNDKDAEGTLAWAYLRNPEADADEVVISEEVVRWMTEGTNPNNVPRSDCG